MTDDNGFATYQDYLQMANDRDDSLDPEFRDPDGYCPHGNYVGGCGPDLMCGWCEDGISPAQADATVRAWRTRTIREAAQRAERMLARLLATGRWGGIDAASMAQESSYVANPRSRYGRH